MRKPILITAAVALSALIRSTAHSETMPRPPAYHLVWSDEFNYTGPPDPAKWNYEHGFVRNNEPQRYTEDSQNVRVENGHLVIEARADAAHPGQYTSACVITAGRAAWTYGRIEVRAQLPTAAGAWPAIWMLGDSFNTATHHQGWPLCGEIDIMELWGASDPHSVRSTVHFSQAGQHASIGAPTHLDDAGSYHVYTAEWTPASIAFSVDGKVFETVPVDDSLKIDGDAFHRPQYLLLNLALEPKRSLIDNAKLPMRMLVDWVRVYQKN